MLTSSARYPQITLGCALGNQHIMDKPGAFAFKCKCCNNPWQIESSDGSAGKTIDFGFCEPCKENPTGPKLGLDPANIDESHRAQDDFYMYSNGTWKRNNPCPPAYPRWGVFNVLNEANQVRLKTILDDLESDTSSGGSDDDFERKLLIDYHKAYMDTEMIERQGILPMVPIIQKVQAMTQENMTATVASLYKDTGVGAFFRYYAMPSKDDSSHTMLTLIQGGLGLPDRDYYFEDAHDAKRDAYILYLEKVFKLLGEKGCTDDVKIGGPYKTVKGQRAAAKAVFDFEKLLAAAHMTRSENRDPMKTWNKMDWEALCKLVWPKPASWSEYLTKGVTPPEDSFFNMSEYFSTIGHGPSTLGEINVANISALQAAVKLACPSNLDAIRHYVIALQMKAAMPFMSEEIYQIHFDFFAKEMSGTKEIKERWKRALDAQMSDLPDCMGKLYVKRYFDESCKQKALAIVEDVKEALRERLNEVKWMNDETRKQALEKMDAFNCKIGYPDEGAWVDYAPIKGKVGSSSAVANFHICNAHSNECMLNEVNKPTNRAKWAMPCQMINAYYHPMLNEIVFPAAILQAPFFDPEADDAVQYGSLGCIAGHEMTHGFDDSGRKYDSKGTLRDWWTGTDGEEYDKRAKVMIEQANAHMVYDQNLKGELTVGENIADLGGVKLAMRALKKKIGDTPVEPVNGFSPVQRFCLSWSQVWRQNATKEYQLQMVTLDPHGPSDLRANNTLANCSDFYEAFGVTEDDKMFIAPAERVDIW